MDDIQGDEQVIGQEENDERGLEWMLRDLEMPQEAAMRGYTKRGKNGVPRRKITISATTIQLEERERDMQGSEGKSGEVEWVVDPGASDTVLNNREYFVSLEELDEWRDIVTVNKGEVRFRTRATHSGKYVFCATQGGVITGTAYFAEISESILSTDQMQRDFGGIVSTTHEGHRHVLDVVRVGEEREQYVMEAGVPMKLKGNFVGGRLGMLREEKEEKKERSGGKICMHLTAVEKSMLDHVRYGHVCDQKRAATIKGGGMMGAKVGEGVGRKLYCEVCAMSKMKKQGKLKTKREEELRCVPGHVIQIDRLISPVESISGHNSAIVVVDVGTRYCQVYLQKTKTMEEFLRDVVPQIIQEAANQRKQGELRAKDITVQIRSGGGDEVDEWMRIRVDGEFKDQQVRWMWKMAGFVIQTTGPYTSDANPFVERLNGTLGGTVRAALVGAKMPQEMWGDAMMMAARIYNVMAHSAFTRGGEKGTKGALASPEMRRSGRVPKDRDMHPPFCPVAIWTNPEKMKLGKWDERGELGIFVGWDENDPHKYLVRRTGGKSVRELVATKDKEFMNIVETHHVLFDDCFNSCKEESPLSRMFRDRKEVRGEMALEVGGDLVFKFSGRGAVDKIVDEVRKSARLENKPEINYEEEKREDVGREEMPEQQKGAYKLPPRQGKQGGGGGSGKRVSRQRQIQQQAEKIRELQVQVGKTEGKAEEEVGGVESGSESGDDLGSATGIAAVCSKRDSSAAAAKKRRESETVERRREERRERCAAEQASGNVGGMLGMMAMGGARREILRVCTTVVQENLQRQEDKERWEDVATREIVDQSLGGKAKKSSQRDHEGWEETLQKMRLVDLAGIADKGVLANEKPWKKGVLKMVQDADEKEILFNKNERAVFEEVASEDIPEWAEVYPVEFIRVVKEGQGLEGGYALGELFVKSRAVVCDVAKRMMKRRTDPGGEYADWKITVVAVNAEIESKRMFYMLASYFGATVVMQLDAKCAFTHCLVEPWVHIYIRMHPAMKQYFTEGVKVLRLRRYLYGLRESPRKWFDMVSKAVREYGFEDLGGAFDKCFFVKKTASGKIAVLLIHTDDMLGFSTELGCMEEFDMWMKKKFDVTAQQFKGEHVYCGLNASKNKMGGWSIGQEKYIDKVMVALGITEKARSGGRQLPYKFCVDPLGHAEQAEEDSEEEEAELQREFGFQYATAAGMCVHLLQTRLDCDMTIRQLARFSKRPRRIHYEAMTHFLRYIKGNKGAKMGYNWGQNRGICAKINGIVRSTDSGWDAEKDGVKTTRERYLLEACCDSEHAGHADSKQVFSATVFVNGGPIASRSVVASRIAKGTMGAEALACSEADDMIEVYAEMLRRIEKRGEGKWGLDPGVPVIMGDNQSVIDAVVHNDRLWTIHAPAHIRIKLEAVRLKVLDGELEVVKVGTNMNPSDIGTKTLPSLANKRMSGLMMNDVDEYFTQRYGEEGFLEPDAV